MDALQAALDAARRSRLESERIISSFRSEPQPSPFSSPAAHADAYAYAGDEVAAARVRRGLEPSRLEQRMDDYTASMAAWEEEEPVAAEYAEYVDYAESVGEGHDQGEAHFCSPSAAWPAATPQHAHSPALSAEAFSTPMAAAPCPLREADHLAPRTLNGTGGALDSPGAAVFSTPASVLRTAAAASLQPSPSDPSPAGAMPVSRHQPPPGLR